MPQTNETASPDSVKILKFDDGELTVEKKEVEDVETPFPNDTMMCDETKEDTTSEDTSSLDNVVPIEKLASGASAALGFLKSTFSFVSEKVTKNEIVKSVTVPISNGLTSIAENENVKKVGNNLKQFGLKVKEQTAETMKKTGEGATVLGGKVRDASKVASKSLIDVSSKVIESASSVAKNAGNEVKKGAHTASEVTMKGVNTAGEFMTNLSQSVLQNKPNAGHDLGHDADDGSI